MACGYLFVIAIAMICTGCSAAAQLGVSSGSTPRATPTTVAPDVAASAGAPDDDRPVVPDLIGKTLDEARAIVKAAGFTSEVEGSEQPSCAGATPGAEGHILCQDPEPGQRTNRYAMIQVVIYQPHRFSGMILPQQLAALRGLTVDEARRRLRELGHDGPVRTHVSSDFATGCAADHVCEVGPGGARSLHDEIILFLKPRLEITAP
ncbi:MAG TPA: PASTA domain-containing protein [Kofleriaceae bacterium]|jgi:hypothetical protein|nr:PASTA domain-containing protein [Kofleriaceae bacterium]